MKDISEENILLKLTALHVVCTSIIAHKYYVSIMYTLVLAWGMW
jgi:hypothetical protein